MSFKKMDDNFSCPKGNLFGCPKKKQKQKTSRKMAQEERGRMTRRTNSNG